MTNKKSEKPLLNCVYGNRVYKSDKIITGANPNEIALLPAGDDPLSSWAYYYLKVSRRTQVLSFTLAPNGTMPILYYILIGRNSTWDIAGPFCTTNPGSFLFDANDLTPVGADYYVHFAVASGFPIGTRPVAPSIIICSCCIDPG